jgi:hypothetical protein
MDHTLYHPYLNLHQNKEPGLGQGYMSQVCLKD